MIAERAYKTGFIKGNEPILALAGSRTGIDTAFILRITPPGGRPYGIDLIRIIAHPHQKSDFGPISAAN